MQFYHDTVTQQSFDLLQDLRRRYNFILIGGWGVWVWTNALKSKDIDIAVDFKQLAKLKTDWPLTKNERLSKYEIKLPEIDVDIYVSHYSNPGLPVERLVAYAVSQSGFTVARPEALLVLKQHAYAERQGTPKGEKDKLDMLSLLMWSQFEMPLYKKIAAASGRDLASALRTVLQSVVAAPELGLNPHQYSRLKKHTLADLEAG